MTPIKNKNDFPKQNDETRIGVINSNNWRHEFTWLLLILVAGLLPRLVFINFFPSRPVSDFANILDFALLFRSDLFAKGAWQWQYFSPGLPLIIATMLNFIHQSPESVERWATAISTGLVPVLPYLLWKDVFRRRTRIIAAFLLALWPGQILFSSVLAQDNWIIFPTVALSVLAVRNLVVKKDGNPVLSALLYVVTVAVRQEMLIALLPVTIVAALGTKTERRFHNILIGSSIVGIFFAALILQRGIATGRYALTTEHFGMSILGTYIPGAGMGWLSPIPYLEATHPELLEQERFESNLDSEALNLAWQEFLRRPRFHLVRIVGATLSSLFGVDKQVTWWSLGAEGVLPDQYQKPALALNNSFAPLLQIYTIIVHTLFAFSIFFALRQRYILKWIGPVVATLLLKLGLHAVIVSIPRYFVVIIGLELLVFSIVTEVCFRPENMRLLLGSSAAGLLSVLVLSLLSTQARNYNLLHDEISQLTYRFSLQFADVQIECTMNQGHLVYYAKNEASFELINPEPRPRESAIVLCEMHSNQLHDFSLLVLDSYHLGGFPDRVNQIVYINGTEVLRHDMAAEPWTGWLIVPLGKVGPETPLSFSVEMRALNPDPGWGWGRATFTQFRVEPVNDR